MRDGVLSTETQRWTPARKQLQAYTKYINQVDQLGEAGGAQTSGPSEVGLDLTIKGPTRANMGEVCRATLPPITCNELATRDGHEGDLTTETPDLVLTAIDEVRRWEKRHLHEECDTLQEVGEGKRARLQDGSDFNTGQTAVSALQHRRSQ